MRGKIYFFVIIVILVLGGIFIYNSLKGDKTVLKETEKAVYNYVVNTEGNKDEDIISIEPYYLVRETKECLQCICYFQR